MKAALEASLMQQQSQYNQQLSEEEELARVLEMSRNMKWHTWYTWLKIIRAKNDCNRLNTRRLHDD